MFPGLQQSPRDPLKSLVSPVWASSATAWQSHADRATVLLFPAAATQALLSTGCCLAHGAPQFLKDQIHTMCFPTILSLLL